MNRRRWIALMLAVPWAIQVAFLWPLPIGSGAAADLIEATSPGSPIAEVYRAHWQTWLVRLSFIAVSISAIVLGLRGLRAWTLVYLSSALGFLVVFGYWYWFELQTDIVLGMLSGGYRWVWSSPFQLVNLVFSIAVILALGYVAFALAKGRHAI